MTGDLAAVCGTDIPAADSRSFLRAIRTRLETILA